VSSIPIPRPFAAFRSIKSPDSPFEFLRRFVAREIQQSDLAFSEVFLNPCDWAELRFQTWRWLHMRGEAESLEGLTEAGKTAPRISKAVLLGFAEVAR
jgi:hypothetical protein